MGAVGSLNVLGVVELTTADVAGVGWASVTDIGRLRPLLKDDWVSINGRSPDHVSSPSGLEERFG